jgi:cytosine/adenosine deaminase-related metal-dependent hydrolase
VTQLYAADHVLPVGAEPIRRGAVAVRDGAIAMVGPFDAVRAAHPDADLEDLGCAVLMPALVNAHTHLEYAGYGGFGDGLPFAAWLADHIARRPRLEAGDVEAQAALGALLCLQAGVGTIGDASYAGASLAAATAAGLRGTVHLEAFGGPDADPAAVAAGLAERLDALAPAATGLVGLGVSPHSPYSVAPAVFAALVGLARARGVTAMAHVAESAAELEAVRDGTGPIADALARLTRIEATGRHPVDLLADADLLGPGLILVHAVQVDDAQAAVIGASGAAVVHCPRSNALLGCGAAPVHALRAAGATVAIGTDSPASAGDFDIWAELRAAVQQARTRAARADALTAAEALRMATLDGARALGLADRVGALAPGLRADLVAVELAGTPFAAAEDPAVAVLMAGTPERVLLTIVDGVVRYRRSADAERVAAAVAAAEPGRRRMIGDH